MISDEDADRIARAHTREQGRLFWRGCFTVLAVMVMATIIITLLSLR